MAVWTLAPMVVCGLVGHESFPCDEKLEGSGQSFKKGELLIYSSGKLIVSTADPASIVEGIALGDAAGVVNSKVLFAEMIEGLEVEMSFMGAAAADYVLAQTDIGVAYGVAVSSNKWYLDQSETSATLFRIKGPAYPCVVGDTNARVIARVVTGKYLT